jgi:hypothetical protein
MSDASRETFVKFDKLSTISTSAVGQNTGDNDRFLKFWYEVSDTRTNFQCGDRQDTNCEDLKWYPYNKGGGYRKWFGNFEYVVNWQYDASEIKEYAVERNDGKHWSRYVQNLEWLFHEGITWSDVTTGRLAGRFLPGGFISDVSGHSAFFEEVSPLVGLGIINSKFSFQVARVLNPTIHFQAGNYRDLPYSPGMNTEVTESAVGALVNIATCDWDAYETSWDFTTLPLLSPDHRAETLAASYAKLRAHWQGMTDEMQRLEEENNRIFIDAYGLQDELTPEVLVEEITITCNPAYRYGVKGTAEDREARLREDTVAELLHYAVGCMFGRYSLDAPGLILANQGEGIEEYLAALQQQGVPEPSFAPDRDNVIPVLDADWFADDIVTRARDFLRVTFGEAKFRENLAFVEAALGKDLRKWFTKDFFDYHVRRYKKRPIYWMFSSPKGSFNALIYMHRYRPDTVSVVLNQYLREFIHKLELERGRLEKLADDPTATQGQRTRAQKDIGAVIKQIDELTAWERDVVYPMAQQKIAIDLDDGVKRYYPLFAGALKPIQGLEAATTD